MLTGAELLAKVKELGDVSKSDLVRGCGYVSTKKDGTERLNFTAFYEALLEAKGMNLGAGGGRGGKGRPGRQLSYAIKVQLTATCSSARPTPHSWAWSLAMSSRSSWAASRSSSSPWGLPRRSEARLAEPHIHRLEPLHPPALTLLAMQHGGPVSASPVGRQSAHLASGAWLPG